MNELPETWVLCEADEKFLKSLRIAGNDWRNTNQRFRDDYHAHKSDFHAERPGRGNVIASGFLVAALFWVPVLIYLWRTSR